MFNVTDQHRIVHNFELGKIMWFPKLYIKKSIWIHPICCETPWQNPVKPIVFMCINTFAL